MGDYLVVNRTADDDRARGLSDDLTRLARNQGKKITALNPHTWLATWGPNPPKILEVGAWTLIGDVFNRRSPSLPPTHPDAPWDYERKLLARFWGRYVGVRFTGGDRPMALIRDPSGGLECAAWTQDRLSLVCSSAEDWMIDRLRPPWRINRQRLAQTLYRPITDTGQLLLDGLVALEPGALQPFPLQEPAAVLWRPSDFARRSLGPAPSIAEASALLTHAVDEAVSGFVRADGLLAVEVSGGLDSSIVAASVVRQAPDTVRAWLNAHGATLESDERPFARLLGHALGFTPLCAAHETEPMTPASLESAGQGFRPAAGGLDRAYDLHWGRLIRGAGASALITGKGGDSILMQAASPDVFADLWRSRGWRALWSRDTAELAAANEVSVWTMVRDARRRRDPGVSTSGWEHPMLAPLTDDAGLHPWLQDCEAFGPAKLFQIAGVADSVSHNLPTALSATVDVRNPLGAQPVVEACLALPAAILTVGGRDRGLARRAFADRLPVEISDRRSKGDMTRLYARMLIDNLDSLRPWLIEGRLAALGLIDAAAAEQELTAEALMARGRYATVLATVAVEAWLRVWERRLGPTS